MIEQTDDKLRVVQNPRSQISGIYGEGFSMHLDFQRDIWILRTHGRTFEFIPQWEGAAICYEETE